MRVAVRHLRWLVFLGLVRWPVVVPSKLLVSVDVSLDSVQTATPLQLFEGQDIQDAVVTFCRQHDLLDPASGMASPVVQQLAQVLQSRLQEQQQQQQPSPRKREPTLTVSVTIDNGERAMLQHFAGQDPREEAVEFCARYGIDSQDPSPAAQARLQACVAPLEHELRSRLADLASQRIRDAVTGSTADGRLANTVALTVPVELANGQTRALELLHNEAPVDAARRFLEQQGIPQDTDNGRQLVRTLENALNSRLTSAVSGPTSDGNALLFTIPLTVDNKPATLEIFEGQSSVNVAQAFCHRPEHGLRNAALVECIQRVEILVREKIAALAPMAPDLAAPMAPDASALPAQLTADDEPLFTLPVTLGDVVTAVPYFPQFTPNQTANAFCTTHWTSISSGLAGDVQLGDCTSLIKTTIEGVLDRIVQRSPALP